MTLLEYALAGEKPLNGLHDRLTSALVIIQRRVSWRNAIYSQRYPEGASMHKVELRERIIAEFAALDNDTDLCPRICHTLSKEPSCVNTEGQHFEDRIEKFLHVCLFKLYQIKILQLQIRLSVFIVIWTG